MISFKTLALGVSILGMSACGNCDQTQGTVALSLMGGGVIYDYGTPVVTVTYPSGVEVDYSVGTDGYLEFEVEEGTYILDASDDVGGCFTEDSTTIEVESCGLHEVELQMEICFG